MQIHSRKRFKKAKTKKGRARQANNYQIAKLRSSGLFDSSQRGKLKIHRISDMSPEERAEFGLLPLQESDNIPAKPYGL